MPEVIYSPDVTAYGEKTRRGQDVILFAKRMRDGTVLVVQEVRVGRRRLALLNMRKLPAAKDALSVLRTSPLYARDDGGDGLSVVEHDRSSTDPKPSIADQVQAFVRDGVVALVADQIAPDTDVKGLMLHEVGVHLTRLGKSDREFQAILKQFSAMAKNGQRARKAMDRVPEDTPSELRLEEGLGYFVEENPSLSFSQRVIAWFRSKLREWVSTSDRFATAHLKKWVNDLTESDLIYMAQAATRRAVDTSAEPATHDPGSDESPQRHSK